WGVATRPVAASVSRAGSHNAFAEGSASLTSHSPESVSTVTIVGLLSGIRALPILSPGSARGSAARRRCATVRAGSRHGTPRAAPGRRSTMEVFDGIRTLLAVRRYQDRAVPEPVVRKIVEAGRLTGSAMNLQPWHFVVVQDRETLRRLGALARSGRYTAEAPLAIVVAGGKTGYAGS